MTIFTVSILIRQPIETVVKALMNPENFPYWQKDLQKFEVIQGRPGEAGAIGLLHYRQKGRSYVMEDKLIYCEPGVKYVSQVSGDVISARVETTLRDSGNGTGMNVTWSGKGKIFFLKIMLPFLRGRMIRQSQEELDLFKYLVEKQGENFHGNH